MGAFHSAKNSENFETGTNNPEIPWQSFRKSGNFRTSEKRAIHTENSVNSARNIKSESYNPFQTNQFLSIGYLPASFSQQRRMD